MRGTVELLHETLRDTAGPGQEAYVSLVLLIAGSCAMAAIAVDAARDLEV